MWKFLNFVIHKCNICRIHGDVTSDTTHGDSDICFFKGRGIIDTVADHTDFFLFLLIFADPIQLIFRQAVCMNLSDMKLSCDCGCCVLMISCKKNRFYPKFGQTIDHLYTLFTKCICQCQISCHPFIYCKINQCTTLIQIFLYLFFHILRHRNLIFFHHIHISGEDFVFIHLTGYPASRNHLKRFC